MGVGTQHTRVAGMGTAEGLGQDDTVRVRIPPILNLSPIIPPRRHLATKKKKETNHCV